MALPDGTTVRVHYTGTLDDGSQFDSSEGRDPLEFTIGAGQVIGGFERAVADLDVGADATVSLPPEEAYGERLEEALQQVPLEAFGEQVPVEGAVVELAAPDGRRMAATITGISDDVVELDFNHPLAGETLTFKISLVEVVAPD